EAVRDGADEPLVGPAVGVDEGPAGGDVEAAVAVVEGAGPRPAGAEAVAEVDVPPEPQVGGGAALHAAGSSASRYQRRTASPVTATLPLVASASSAAMSRQAMPL